MRSRAQVLLLGLVLVLSACGGEDADTGSGGQGAQGSSAQSNAGGPGVYVVDENGTKATITVPARRDNAIVRELEAFRKLTQGTAPGAYISIEVDNTQGTKEAAVDDLRIVTKDGKTIQTQTPDDLINAWRDTLPADDTTTYNKSVELNNRLMKAESVLPGAKSKTVRATPDALNSIKSVFYGEMQAKKH